MLNDILKMISGFLGVIKLPVAAGALAGLFFSGTVFYICSLVLVAEILLPYARSLVDETVKFMIKS